MPDTSFAYGPIEGARVYIGCYLSPLYRPSGLRVQIATRVSNTRHSERACAGLTPLLV